MELRIVNFLLVLVTGRVWKGGKDIGGWMRPGKLWDYEEGLYFVYDHFVGDLLNVIVSDGFKKMIEKEIKVNEYS